MHDVKPLVREEARIAALEAALETRTAEVAALRQRLQALAQEPDHALKVSEEKYRGIIENLDLGILEVDNDDVIVRPYSRFSALTGYEPEELIGKVATDILLDADQRAILEEKKSKRQQGESDVYEIRIRCKDGSHKWVLISGAPIYGVDGQVKGSIGIHLNITARKEMEEALLESKKRAEKAEKAQKTFLANMSHEIRTPLNAIIGMAHLLYDTRPTPTQLDYLNVLKNSANHLHNLISNILDYSKIEAGKVDIQEKPFDLIGLVRTLQKTFQLKIDKKPVTVAVVLDPMIPPYIVGDAILLNQILMNLMSNAEKFTEAGEIGIRVKVLMSTKAHIGLRFDVYDSGVGIAPEQIPYIFEDFKQLDNELKIKYKGTGLGLTITKKILELQGGQLEVQSVPQQGSTFSFYISYGLVETQNLTSPSVFNCQVPQAPVLRPETVCGKIPKRILLVEDNDMNRKYAEGLLQKWQLEYDTATNGKEATEWVQKQEYGLILMDIQMPIMDGNEAAVFIRNTQNLNVSTPIIALTASALIDKKMRASATGINDFLVKPFSPNQLREKINGYLPMCAHTKDLSKEAFYFEDSLDVAYLESFYERDYFQAIDMFQTFLDHILPEIEMWQAEMHDLSPKFLIQKVHKIKPSLSMVGLTLLATKAEKIEDMSKEVPDKALLMTYISTLTNQILLFKPVLQKQLKKLKNYVELYYY